MIYKGNIEISLSAYKNASNKERWLIEPAAGLGDYVMPGGTTAIKPWCFYMNDSLTGIHMPPTLKTIHNNAFELVSGLNTVSIPSGVTYIGTAAFKNCTNLVTVNMPSQITSISDEVFSGCSKLENITIPSSVTTIGRYAFQGCNALQSITIPNSITSILEAAFGNCKGLTEIEIPSTVTTLGQAAFSGCHNLSRVIINEGVESIEDRTFYVCPMTYVDLPSTITSIGRSAFDFRVEYGGSATFTMNVIFRGNLPHSVEDSSFTGGWTNTSYGHLYRNVYIKSTTFDDNVTSTIVNNVCKNTTRLHIYVPAELVDTYKAAPQFANYVNCIEADPTE